MKNLIEKLVVPLAAGIVALTGCASNSTKYNTQPVTTNLAENIKGYDTTSLEYLTERFNLTSKTEYVVSKKPKEFSLPDGTRFTSDAVMRINQTLGVEEHCEKNVNFELRPGEKYFAVAPVNFSKKNNRKVLYLVNPQNDKKDIIYLPSQFNISKRNISPEFSVDKVTTKPVIITQTLCLPHNKNIYAFRGSFPVYTDATLNTLAVSEPVVLMPTNPTKTNQLIDYGTNQRGFKGALQALVQLPLAPKLKKGVIPITGGNTIDVSETPTLQQPTSSQKPEMMQYTVKSGDTPFDIAQSKGMCPKQFSDANPGLCKGLTENSWKSGKCKPIYPGQKLKIWKKRKIRR